MKRLLFIAFIFFTQLNWGQTSRKYSNEFLSIGVDAASFGMAKSVVATSHDVNSIYWNPAGLVAVNAYQGSIMHAEYFAGIAKYDYLAFAMPIDDRSSVGISLIRFGVDDILDTTKLIDEDGNVDYANINKFSAVDYALNLAYARTILSKGLDIGFNTKIIRRIIGDFATSWGFGLDASMQLEKNNWKFGLMLRDITTTFNSWSFDENRFEDIKNATDLGNQELPEKSETTLPKAQLGIAREFDLGKKSGLLTEVDFNFRFTETNDIISSSGFSVDPTFGFQVDFDDMVFLRGGVGNIQNTTTYDDTNELSIQPNFGVGFKYKGIQIDYAMTNIASVGNALYSNIFSIKVDFDSFR